MFLCGMRIKKASFRAGPNNGVDVDYIPSGLLPAVVCDPGMSVPGQKDWVN